MRARFRWRESVMFMAAKDVTLFVELGAGKVLTGLIRRIVENASGIGVAVPAEVDAYKAVR